MSHPRDDLYEGNASEGDENRDEADETEKGREIHYFDGVNTYCKAHNQGNCDFSVEIVKGRRVCSEVIATLPKERLPGFVNRNDFP